MRTLPQIQFSQFFEVGTGRLKNFSKLLLSHKLQFKNVVLLADKNTLDLGGDIITADFEKSKIRVTKHLISNSDEKNVKDLETVITKTKPDLVIGFGGGKVLDVAKLSAGETKIKYISVPTTLSNDGIASPVAVIKDKHNIPISHITIAPVGVIVDINIVKQAPSRHIKAGIGDLISNFSAVFDVVLARSKDIERIDTTALALAEAGPRNLLELNVMDIKDTEFLSCLARGLIKSGVAMCIVGSSRPASGSEHKISHSIDHLHSPRETLHGEQAGIAALFTMALQDNTYLREVQKFYHHISFPQKLDYLSLTVDQFIDVVFTARKIRPERHTILEHKEFSGKEIKEIIHDIDL